MMRALQRTVTSLLRREQGVSLLETIVALGILGFIGVAFVGGLSTASKATETLQEQVVAESLARAQMEELKGTAYDPGLGYVATVSAPTGYDISVNAVTIAAGKQEITVTITRNNVTLLSVSSYKTNR